MSVHLHNGEDINIQKVKANLQRDKQASDVWDVFMSDLFLNPFLLFPQFCFFLKLQFHLIPCDM